jgi:hypothetical protein
MRGCRIARGAIALLLLGACTTSASPSDVDASADATSSPYPLPPDPPDGGYPSCDDSGIAEAGPCCANFFCLEGDDGGCPLASDMQVTNAWQIQYGQCSCGGAAGPYANPGGGASSCCYISHSRGCM